MDYGITRICITDPFTGPGAVYEKKAKPLRPVADEIYFGIFPSLPRQSSKILVSKEEHEAGYDSELGIDVFLKFKNGMVLTLQEKFLFKKYNTVTVEWFQNPEVKEGGDWFNLRCQLYFVGYDQPYTGKRFSRWVLVDWPRLVIQTIRGNVRWRSNCNRHYGARASFKYTEIDDLPTDCVIATHITECAKWMLHYIGKREVPMHIIHAVAQANGFPKSTVNRAIEGISLDC